MQVTARDAYMPPQVIQLIQFSPKRALERRPQAGQGEYFLAPARPETWTVAG
jgi:hypothetical protein